jgi:hypothetical protein
MLSRISLQLSVACAGLLFWSSAPAAVFEINHHSPRDSLSFNADEFRGDTSSFLHGAPANHGLSPGLVAQLNRTDFSAGISIRAAIELAGALGIHGAASLNNPGTLLWNESGHDFAAVKASGSEAQGAALDAGAGAPDSIPSVSVMLMIGAGLVCYQMRRKSKVRLIRFASR